jgi:hypothetical protein
VFQRLIFRRAEEKVIYKTASEKYSAFRCFEETRRRVCVLVIRKRGTTFQFSNCSARKPGKTGRRHSVLPALFFGPFFWASKRKENELHQSKILLLLLCTSTERKAGLLHCRNLCHRVPLIINWCFFVF